MEKQHTKIGYLARMFLSPVQVVCPAHLTCPHHQHLVCPPSTQVERSRRSQKGDTITTKQFEDVAT